MDIQLHVSEKIVDNGIPCQLQVVARFRNHQHCPCIRIPPRSVEKHLENQ